MSRVSPALLAKIESKRGISKARAYELIAAKARQLMVDRHLAALAVAADIGINVNKKAYASSEDRVALASALRGGTNHSAPSTPATEDSPRPRERSKKARTDNRPRRKSNSVMVVYGRNMRLSGAMFSFLRSIGLVPIEWSQALRKTRKAAPYVGEVLNTIFRTAAAVVVLLTPDDEARLKPEFRKQTDPSYEKELTGQARPNVLFEAGRAFGSHPDSTVLVQVGVVRPFSDTAGIHVANLTNRVESRKELADKLEAAGCAVDLTGTAWMTEGNFDLGPGHRRRSA
jgi:predicted nucleotide-binding protein